MTHPTAFHSVHTSSARSSRLRLFPVLLLLTTACGGQVTDSEDEPDQAAELDQTAALNGKVLSQTALPGVVSNAFTWGSVDYTLLSAEWVETTAGSYVNLVLDAKNRIPYGTTSLLDWTLHLADGSTFAATGNHWFNLDPGQTQTFSLQFPAAQLPSLTGAKLVPRQSNLNYAPAHIPLDRPFSDAPRVLHPLLDKTFTTQPSSPSRPNSDPASVSPVQRWSVTIKSAQLGLNSNVDGGERALAGHQFVDVVFDVHYPATNTEQAYFGADLASVEVHGSPGYEVFDSVILKPNQAGEVHFAFEIPDDAAEFVLHVDTNDAHPQSLTVPLSEQLR